MKKLTTWVAYNGIAAALIWFGIYIPNPNEHVAMVAVASVWVLVAMAIFLTFGSVTKRYVVDKIIAGEVDSNTIEYERLTKHRPISVPISMDIIYDTSIATLIALGGLPTLAAAYLTANIMAHYSLKRCNEDAARMREYLS